MDEPYGPDHPDFVRARARLDPFFDRPVCSTTTDSEHPMYGVRDTAEYRLLAEKIGTLEAKFARMKRVEAAALKLLKAIESGNWKAAKKRLESAIESAHR